MFVVVFFYPPLLLSKERMVGVLLEAFIFSKTIRRKPRWNIHHIEIVFMVALTILHRTCAGKLIFLTFFNFVCTFFSMLVFLTEKPYTFFLLLVCLFSLPLTLLFSYKKIWKIKRNYVIKWTVLQPVANAWHFVTFGVENDQKRIY